MPGGSRFSPAAWPSRVNGSSSPQACRSTCRARPTCSRSRRSRERMRLTFLGTGTSFGVPQVGCECAVCRSADPRDRRTRCGPLMEVNGRTILIDTAPELRLQLLAAGITRVDAVLYTHEHADHVNGIDDLRIFSVRQPTPRWSAMDRPRRSRRSAARFRYIFDEAAPFAGTSKPRLEPASAGAGQPADDRGSFGAAAGLSARASPGLRLSVRDRSPTLPMSRRFPQAAPTAARRRAYPGAQRLWWRPHPTHLSASTRRSRRPGPSARSGPTSPT